MKNLIGILLLLAPAGCDLAGEMDEAELRLETDRSAYQDGQEIELSLANHSRQSFYVHPDLCGAVLHRHVRSGWQVAQPGGACYLVVATLEQGEVIEATMPLVDALTPGTYRFAYTVAPSHGDAADQEGEALTVYSPAFAVTE